MGRRSPVLALPLIAAMSAGCFSAVAVPPPKARRAPERGDVSTILGDVADMRGLRVKRPVTVDFVPSEIMRRERNARLKRDAEATAPYEAFLAGFDFLPPSSERSRAPDTSIGSPFVAAFYDRAQNRVFAPNDLPATQADQGELRATLAHELHHALQAQHFPPPQITDADAALAYRALREGDAELATVAFISKERGVPVRRSVLHRRYLIDGPRKLDANLAPEQRADWSQAPAIASWMSTFPYLEGTAFVADLYRTGGFALVDRAHAAPPVTTEQILHPQKYLDGELPRRIRDLTAPPGWTTTTTEPLGEIGVRLFLEPCLGKAAATRAAEGWNGDRAFALESNDKFVIAWASAWDTETDAVEVEDALSRLTRCLKPNDAGGKTIGVAFSVRREGSVVGFVRGGGDQERASLATALTSLADAAPERRPLVAIRVPELKPPPPRRQGTITDGRFRSDWLGVWGPLPVGFDGKTNAKKSELVVRDRAGYGAGTVSLTGRLQTPERVDQNLNEVEGDFAALFQSAELELSRLGDDEIETGLGRARERTWLIKKYGAKQRLVVIPICGGTGGLVIDYSYGSPAAKKALEAWVASFQWLATAGRAPVCEYLDPR